MEGTDWVIVSPEVSVAAVYTPRGVREVRQANARLISAAPDLLEALEAMLREYNTELMYTMRALTNLHIFAVLLLAPAPLSPRPRGNDGMIAHPGRGKLAPDRWWAVRSIQDQKTIASAAVAGRSMEEELRPTLASSLPRPTCSNALETTSCFAFWYESIVIVPATNCAPAKAALAKAKGEANA